MDFRKQLEKDMDVFHNPKEFASFATFWYDRKPKEAPVILDFEEARKRIQKVEDHAPGVSEIEALAYIAEKDLSFIPERGHEFAVEFREDAQEYNILEVRIEDGEIILELGAYAE